MCLKNKKRVFENMVYLTSRPGSGDDSMGMPGSSAPVSLLPVYKKGTFIIAGF